MCNFKSAPGKKYSKKVAYVSIKIFVTYAIADYLLCTKNCCEMVASNKILRPNPVLKGFFVLLD